MKRGETFYDYFSRRERIICQQIFVSFFCQKQISKNARIQKLENGERIKQFSQQSFPLILFLEDRETEDGYNYIVETFPEGSQEIVSNNTSHKDLREGSENGSSTRSNISVTSCRDVKSQDTAEVSHLCLILHKVVIGSVEAEGFTSLGVSSTIVYGAVMPHDSCVYVFESQFHKFHSQSDGKRQQVIDQDRPLPFKLAQQFVNM